MKKLLSLIAVSLITAAAFGQQFSSVATSGQTLFYSIHNGSAWLESPNDGWATSSRPTGNVVIPGTVSYQGSTYPVVRISSFAFSYCTNITSVTIPQQVTALDMRSFYGCSRLASIVIPNTVTTIGEEVFLGCSGLTSVTLPSNITAIPTGMFNNCSGLHSITLPSTVTALGERAFSGCSNLDSIILPSGLTALGDYALSGCAHITHITLPNSLASLGTGVFYECSRLDSVVVPSSIHSLPTQTFYECVRLTHVELPQGLDTIGISAFYHCWRMPNINIPATVRCIKQDAFYQCTGLTSIVIPNSVNRIEGGVFDRSGISDITLPSGLTTIADACFRTCPNLHHITLPASVTTIERLAFQNCSTLTSITCLAPVPPTVGSFAFQSVPSTDTITVPCNSINAYAAAWTNFSNFEGTLNRHVAAQTADSAMGSCAVTRTPSCANDTAQVAAVAGEHCHFDHWSDGSTANPYTFRTTHDTLLTAYFAYEQHSVAATCIPAHMGTVSGTGSYAYGDSATLAAIPSDTGRYTFVRWSDSCTQAERRVEVVSDTAFEALFAYCPATILLGASEGGSTDPLPDSYGIAVGDTLTACAISAEEYLFTGWVFAANGRTDTCPTDTITLIVDSTLAGNRCTLTACFAPIADTTGIGSAPAANISVWSLGRTLVVRGAAHQTIRIYDSAGRLTALRREADEEQLFRLPAAGIYLVQAGEAAARKVAVK